VGETRRIIGPGGEVVPPHEARMLAAAILRMLGRARDERQRIGERGRAHILEHFEIGRLAERHLQVWKAVASGKPAGVSMEHIPAPRQRAA
jgi:glycosyltransferase involved in cell wall biosynthesis